MIQKPTPADAVAYFARHRLKVNNHRQRLEFTDGDFLDLDWSDPVDHDRSIVLVLHGLPRITAPTLILQAKDDPFMTQNLLPEEHELGPGVPLELSDKGDHTGFFWALSRVLTLLAGK